MNEAAAYGGIMTGGAIQNNTGHRGAAVNIYSDDRDKRAIFTLEDDGLITRNQESLQTGMKLAELYSLRVMQHFI